MISTVMDLGVEEVVATSKGESDIAVWSMVHGTRAVWR